MPPLLKRAHIYNKISSWCRKKKKKKKEEEKEKEERVVTNYERKKFVRNGKMVLSLFLFNAMYVCVFGIAWSSIGCRGCCSAVGHLSVLEIHFITNEAKNPEQQVRNQLWNIKLERNISYFSEKQSRMNER